MAYAADSPNYDSRDLLVGKALDREPRGENAAPVVGRPQGYVATFAAGEQTIDHDTATGTLPGR